MATIRIEYDYVNAKASTLENNANKIERILNSLINDMESNVNSSTWTGPAADNFRRAWENSADEFTKFVQYLKSVQSKVKVAAEESQHYDQN